MKSVRNQLGYSVGELAVLIACAAAVGTTGYIVFHFLMKWW